LTLDRKIMTNVCTGNGGFNIEDLQCLDDNDYNEKLCLFSDDRLWSGSGERTLEIYTKLCSNDKPVYQLQIYNDTNSKHDDVANVDSEISAGRMTVYYLHYDEQRAFSNLMR